jgi:hypothetical protein
MARVSLFFLCLFVAVLAPVALAEDGVADATTMRGKLFCGYQGWFRCPGDGTNDGWKHWSRSSRRIAPDTLTFEMWPDLSDYGDDEKFAVPGFTYPDGSPAHLFSSAHPKTVERHFQWMREHGIDGAFVQRFLVEVDNPSTDKVLENVRAAAAATGRAYAVGYDLSGMPRERVYERLAADWKRLVDDKKVTADERYLRHNGKPVLFVWGFFSDRFGPARAHEIIDFLKGEHDPKYAVTLVGGCQWYWRAEKDPEWGRAFRRFDVISPWNVGNVTIAGDRKQAATHYWKDDLAEAKKAGMAYLPTIYPGFGWTNLKGRGSDRATIPRQKGAFYWRQFVAAKDHGMDMAYVAMFDEVDEATAVFKVTNTPPAQGRFQTYEGLPADGYLKLTHEGAKLLRGERPRQEDVPNQP